MNPTAERRTVERRRVARQKSLLRGTVTFDNRRRAVECLIRDISPFGARLTFDGAVTLPDVLDLTIPQQDRTLRVHVIWRHGQGNVHELGVAFPQAATVSPATPAAAAESGDPGSGPGQALAERVARLEIEIAALKRILKRMKADAAGPEFDVA
jgi:hypothetical protein